MPARLTIASDNRTARTDLAALRAQLEAVQLQAIEANTAIAEGAQAALIPLRDLRVSHEALIQAVRAEVVETVNGQKAKVSAIESELAAVRAVTTEYKRGSAERQALIAREIELQKSLAAVTGETAAAGAAGAAGRRGGRHGSALRAEEGAARGAITRGFGIGGALAGPGFILGAGGAIEVKAALTALKEMQVSLALLRQAVGSAGIGWNQYGEQLLKVVRRQEELSGFTRNQLRESMAQLVRITKDPRESMRLLGVATDVARARHIDLDAATRILVRTWATGGRGLARLGIEVPKVTTHMDKLREAHIKVTNANRAQVLQLTHQAQALDKAASRTAALDAIQKTYGGSAEKYMGTAEGATDKLHNSIEELQIAIGRALLPQISHLADGIAAWIEEEQKAGTLQPTINKYIEEAGKVAHTFWEALKLIVSIIKPLVDGLGGLNNTIKIFIGYLVAKRVYAMYDALVVLRAGITGVGTAAAVAQGEAQVGGLLAKLTLLSKIAPIAIPVTISIALLKTHGFTDFINKLTANPIYRRFPGVESFLNDFGGLIGFANPNDTPPITGPAGGAQSGGSGHGHNEKIIGTPGSGTHSTSERGYLWKDDDAVDIEMKPGQPVYAVESGTIGDNLRESSTSGRFSGWGFTLMADSGSEYYYKHLRSVTIVKGQRVAEGQLLGRGSTTGHIHFARKGGKTTQQVLGAGSPLDADQGFASDLATAKSIGAKGGKKGKPMRGMPTPGPGGGSVDKMAAKHGLRTMYGQTLVNYIATKSKSLGLDPSSVLAVASVEGGFQGKVGDHGTSFGPFQLHAGGALPDNVWSQGPIYARAWANSPQGLDYALNEIAKVAGGATGAAAVTSIVSQFEHPADVAAEVAKATGRIGQTKFKLGRVQGVIPGATEIRDKIREDAKALRDLVNTMITAPGQSPEDIAGRVTSARGRLGALDTPIAAAAQAIIDHLTELRNKLNRMLASGGIVSKAALASVRSQIKELSKALAVELEDEAVGAERARSHLVDAIHKQVQRRQEEQLKQFDKATQAQIASMRKSFETQMKAFDDETQRTLQGFVVAETPAEAALRQFQEQRQAESDAKSMADAIASGDPEQIRQAQLDQQERYLEDSARQSRDAQDKLTQDQQDAYQRQRDDLREALSEREDRLESSYQEQRDIIRQGMEDANADELSKLDENLDDWNRWLENKSKSLVAFYKWVKDTYGLGPGEQAAFEGGTFDRGTLTAIGSRIEDDMRRQVAGGKQVPFATGGTVRAPQFIGRGDMIAARLSHNETVIDSSLTDALRDFLSRGGSGVQVIIPGATLLGRDRDVARSIAEITRPEIERVISYRPLV